MDTQGTPRPEADLKARIDRAMNPRFAQRLVPPEKSGPVTRLWAVGGLSPSICLQVVDDIEIQEINNPDTLLRVFCYALLMYGEDYDTSKWGPQLDL